MEYQLSHYYSDQDLTKHELSVASWCQAVYEEAKQELESHEAIVQLDRSINYLMGKQWSEKRPSYKASPVSNRLWTNLVLLTSYLTDLRHIMEVKANNRRFDDHAKVLNKMVRAWAYSIDIDLILAMVIMHAATTIGYVRQVYNHEANWGEGEIELTPLGAMDLIPIRPSHSLQNSIGVIYRQPKALSWFADRYPVKGRLVRPDDEYSQYATQIKGAGNSSLWARARHVISPQMKRLFGMAQHERKRSAIPMALYREFWIRDSQRNTSDQTVTVGDPTRDYSYAVKPGEKLYPRGRLICMGGDVVLHDGPNPFWHGKFPFSALRLNAVPWQFLGVSEFLNQIPLQDTMNNILAGILDAVKKAVNPPLVAPDNAFSMPVKKSLDPNMPGAKVFYSPAAIAPPTYATPPNLPSYVMETMLYAQRELDSQSGFIDPQSVTRRGIIPAADTIEQLKEGQQTMVRLKVRYIEGFFKDIGQQWVSNAFQFYTLKRRVAVLGADGITWEDYDYDPANMIPDKEKLTPERHARRFTFMIVPGSLLRSSRDPQKALFMHLRRMGDLDLKNLLEGLDLGGMYEDVKRGLEVEGANILMAMVKNAKAGAGGGGALAPDLLRKISNATGENPTPIMQ